MRQGPNGRRPRGRPNRKQHGGPSRPNSFDSNGPEGRIRGNAHQVYEKYIGMARDAVSAGDRVAAESYYQYAEHYFRIINSSTDPEPSDRRPPRHDGNGRPHAGPAAGNGGAAPATDGGSEDREGLDRALRLDGAPSASRQPQAGPSQAVPSQAGQGEPNQGQPNQGQPSQGDDQPHGGLPSDQQGRRRLRQRPPRDDDPRAGSGNDSGGGEQRRPRQPRHGNGQSQADSGRPGEAAGSSGELGGRPDTKAAPDKAANGDDSASGDDAPNGNEPVTA